MTAPLLVTKLFIPPSRPELVSRPRLFDTLSSSRARNLTLVSAPAGFGKTTLIAAWMKALSRDTGARVAWLSLDAEDNDVRRFLTYLVVGLSQQGAISAAAEEQVMAWLQNPEPPSPEALLTPVINQIAANSGAVFFVLDDYHVIEAQAVNDAVAFLLDHLPPQLQLVITTREDPLLPLARLRAQGQLNELRAADLRFSLSESAEFLNQTMGLSLEAADIAALEARTEGWIVGLQLAALSLKGQTDPSKLVRSFSGSNRLVLDYLVDEVLSRQNQHTQDFLLQTSILDRLTAPLCDAVTGQTGGQRTLEALDRANLFLVPLDHERMWFRYHHLFADLLQQRLRQSRPELQPELHERASHWFERADMFPASIQHALAGQDPARAADLAEIAWPDWNAGYRSLQWLEWVKGLPPTVVRDRPVLCVDCAQAHLNGGQLESAEARLQDAELCLADLAETGEPQTSGSRRIVVADNAQFQALPARLATTRAYLAQARGDAATTARHVRQALELLPESAVEDRATVKLLLGLAYWTQGDLQAAYEVFSKSLAREDRVFVSGAFVLAEMQTALGHLAEAEAILERGLRLAQSIDPPQPIGTETLYIGLSHIHRERGDRVAAANALDRARVLGEQVHLPDWRHRWYIAQARLAEARGDLGESLDLLDQAARHHVRTPVPDVRPIAALRAWVQTRLGRYSEARRWADEVGLSAQDTPGYLHEFEHLTLARVLIAQGQRDRDLSLIGDAQGLIDRLKQAAENAGRTGSLIDILVTEALAYDAQNNLPAALGSLSRALTLAEPAGYFRVFIDAGPAMAHLLYTTLAAGRAPKYVQRLLNGFPEVKRRPTPVGDEPQGGPLEPLSDRERDVLQLIAQGLSNQEIATRLFLTLNTVKAHTRNIYGKLGVNSRTQAAARARALGILASD